MQWNLNSLLITLMPRSANRLRYSLTSGLHGAARARMLSGVIQQLANESDGSYRVGKVNVDEQPELAKRFGIASIPTVILFRNGEAVQRQMGVAPKAAFLNMLQEAK